MGLGRPPTEATAPRLLHRRTSLGIDPGSTARPGATMATDHAADARNTDNKLPLTGGLVEKRQD